MQIWFSFGIDLCITILLGYYLIENLLASFAYKTVLLIKKTCSVLLIVFLIGYLFIATINFTQTTVNQLLPNVWAVLRLTSLGNTVFLAILISLLILFLNFVPRRNNKIYLLALLILIYAKAYTGHAAEYDFLHWAVISHAVHILASGAWAGSVITAILLLPFWRKLSLQDSQNIAYKLSAIATIAVPIAVIFGIIDSLRILYGQNHIWFCRNHIWFCRNHIWFSDYFITLAIKVILVITAIGLGLINRWYWLPKLNTQSANQAFIQTIAIESIALIIVVLTAARLGMTMIPG